MPQVPQRLIVNKRTNTFVPNGEQLFSESVLEQSLDLLPLQSSGKGILAAPDDVDERYLATPELDEHSTEKMDFSALDVDAVDDYQTAEVTTPKLPQMGRGRGRGLRK